MVPLVLAFLIGFFNIYVGSPDPTRHYYVVVQSILSYMFTIVVVLLVALYRSSMLLTNRKVLEDLERVSFSRDSDVLVAMANLVRTIIIDRLATSN